MAYLVIDGWIEFFSPRARGLKYVWYIMYGILYNMGEIQVNTARNGFFPTEHLAAKYIYVHHSFQQGFNRRLRTAGASQRSRPSEADRKGMLIANNPTVA